MKVKQYVRFPRVPSPLMRSALVVLLVILPPMWAVWLPGTPTGVQLLLAWVSDVILVGLLLASPD